MIAYGTQSGTACDFANDLGKDLEEYQYFNVKVKDLKDYEPENLPYSNHYLFLIVATYTEGTYVFFFFVFCFLFFFFVVWCGRV